jgi:POT family proton-dependent oligopeptide transporter
MTFLLCVNAGSFSSIATTTVEHEFGFSAAFALPTLAFAFGIAVIYASKGRYISAQPKGSVVLYAF